MRVITTKRIGEYEIVVNLAEPPVDPEASKQRVNDAIWSTDEGKRLTEHKCEMGDLECKAVEAHKKRRSKRYKELRKAQSELTPKLHDAARQFDRKYKELLRELVVYSTPRGAETISDWADLEHSLSNCPADCVVLRDGSTVPRKTVEMSRIDNLSDRERTAEVAELYQILTQEAVQRRATAEVQGKTDALESAQTWLAEKAKEIEDLYKCDPKNLPNI
jgi:hypothetical protein